MFSWEAPLSVRADAARNQRLLLATAREMLAEHGADKLTMDGLAERAGRRKGTVFRRFGTRRLSARSFEAAGNPTRHLITVRRGLSAR